MNRPIVIDSQAVGYRQFHAMGDGKYEDEAVGVIYGFLSQIQMYAVKFKTNRFVFCWDSRSSLRRNRYPFYKLKDDSKVSEEDREALRNAKHQFNMLRTNILTRIGFKNHFIQTGIESDDIIAWIVKNLQDDYIIVTGDNDLFQLLDYADIYHLTKKEIYTRNDFTSEYGITPEQWIEVKQIGGCTSDTVPGIVGVAEKTAIKYLTGTIPKGKKFSAIISDEGKEIILRNRWLVELPLPETAPVKFIEDRFDLDGYLDVCQEYNLRSFMEPKGLSFWRERFEM